MSDLKAQKRLAADELDVGKGRIWLDPEAQEEIEDAITREGRPRPHRPGYDPREGCEDELPRSGPRARREALVRSPVGRRHPEREVRRTTEHER